MSVTQLPSNTQDAFCSVSLYLSLETLDYQIEAQVRPKQQMYLTVHYIMWREGGHFSQRYSLLS